MTNSVTLPVTPMVAKVVISTIVKIGARNPRKRGQAGISPAAAGINISGMVWIRKSAVSSTCSSRITLSARPRARTVSYTHLAYLAKGADLLIFTGGMSVDPDDLTPAAIKNTGAEIITQGVPSQPGNMFTIGYLGSAALIGVPGAAIHAKTTVFDAVLPQLFTGKRFTKDDFVRLGDGGLCQQCPVCHFPNCTFGRY